MEALAGSAARMRGRTPADLRRLSYLSLFWLAARECLRVHQRERHQQLPGLLGRDVIGREIDHDGLARGARLAEERLELGAAAPGPDKLTPRELMDEIRRRSLVLIERQYELLNDVVLPGLAEERIRFLQRADWTREQKRWLSDFFEDEIVPVLTPLTLDPSRPFPRIG
mgnify:CR=1 FL=1